MVLRNKNIIQIGPRSRGGYWKAHKTPNSSQAALEFGNLDVSISWLLLATKNISPRQRPQTDAPWSELSHTQFGFCGYSSEWSNLVTDLHLQRMQETGAKATSIHGLSQRERSSEENWGAAPNRDRHQVERNYSCLPQKTSHFTLEKWRLALGYTVSFWQRWG